ncbi:type IV pilus assembly protein PilE [Luteibacter rhizovicinus]|uniref:Type IV pilus assembly protein PilE n=2 Tax=Luteibacter rhizovicinus TaxID=242606 RepID=A0A4R3Z002_9GAMM|nr:type IV pilus assembly protein PilE [Luteibacter rhizovicinus]
MRDAGFSAIELLLILAAVALLAMFATSSYRQYTFRVRRLEGRHLLLEASHAQERFHARSRRYAYGPDDELNTRRISANAHYALEMDMAADHDAGRGFLLRAIPQGTQAKDVCGELTVDHRGVMLPSRDDGPKHTNGDCW